MSRFARVMAGLALALVGCGGEQNWTSDPSWQGEDRSRSLTTAGDDQQTLVPAAKVTAPDALTWFGVRHDLSMAAAAPRTPACGCLAVEVGMPGKQAFQWDGEVPLIGPDAVVVAVSARGVDCPAEADEGKRRASISGVERDGDDVIVEIEDLPEGRPLALGAIVPKPGARGSLYIVPRDKKVRWVPQGNDKRCRVKSPTAAATSPANGSGAP
jgi:hypothetical protein